MNITHLIIKSRTVATQMQKTNPGAAQHLIRLINRWDALCFAQRKMREQMINGSPQKTEFKVR